MKNTQQPGQVSLAALIGRPRRSVRNPRLSAEWGPSDIQDLLKSIFRDYYIGNLLLWTGDSQLCLPLLRAHLWVRRWEGRSHAHRVGRSAAVVRTALHSHGPSEARSTTSKPISLFHSDRPISRRSIRRCISLRPDTAKGFWLTEMNSMLRTRFLAVIGKAGKDLWGWFQAYERFWEERSEQDESESEKRNALLHVEHSREFGTYLEGTTTRYPISSQKLEIDMRHLH